MSQERILELQNEGRKLVEERAQLLQKVQQFEARIHEINGAIKELERPKQSELHTPKQPKKAVVEPGKGE